MDQTGKVGFLTLSLTEVVFLNFLLCSKVTQLSWAVSARFGGTNCL